MATDALEIRKLIDSIFALQWCRENIVVPLGFERNKQNEKEKLIIAIGNISYLGTIGDFIKRRAADKGMECVFVEKSPATFKRFSTMHRNNGWSTVMTWGFEFSDEAVGCYKKQTTKVELGDSTSTSMTVTTIIEEQALDLATEMMDTRIQQAAAKILISACRTGVSDIHVGPRQENYKVRVRRDGVMQNCDHTTFRRNQTHSLLQKHSTNGYCRTSCIPRRQNPPSL